MNLSTAPKTYDQSNEAGVRGMIMAADQENLKRNQDIHLNAKIYLQRCYNVTAHAGGGQAPATQLTGQVGHVGTVATAADSVKLIPAKAGLVYVLANRGANACQVFGNGSDTINDVAAATGVSQAAGTLVTYACPTDGKWYRS